MTTPTTRLTELAHRVSGGIDIYLFWHEPTDRVTVNVLDARTAVSFELEVDGREALDAFNHPYAYAARIDMRDRGDVSGGLLASGDTRSNSKEPTVNPRRSNHARTDR